MKYLNAVLKSRLLSELDKSEYEEVYEALRISSMHYAKGEVIFFEGDIIDRICIVESGSVLAEKIYVNGENYIADLFDAGSMFAEEIAASRTKSAAINYIAAEDCRVIYISYDSITESKHAAALNKAITYIIADYTVRQAHKNEILAKRGIRERVIEYLGILARKAGGDTVTVKLSREELARYLCVNRSALSNEMSKMKQEGIIDWKGKKYTILRGK